MNIIVLMAALR